MLARKRHVGARQVRIYADRPVDDIAPFGDHAVPKQSHRDVVLHLACVGAGLTANAAIKADCHTVLSHDSSPTLSSLRQACH